MIPFRSLLGWLILLTITACATASYGKPMTGWLPVWLGLSFLLGVILIVDDARTSARHWKEAREVERLKAQMAQICLAIEGCTDPAQTVPPERADWTCTYDKALKLRQKYDRLRAPVESVDPVTGLTAIVPPSADLPIRPSRPGVLG